MPTLVEAVEMLTIAPPPRAFIAGTARLMQWNMPWRLTSITRYQSSSSISSIGARGPLDAGIVHQHVEAAERRQPLVEPARNRLA